MIALTRYHVALLLRSQRWLPPLLLYAALLAVGVQAGEPQLDSLGFAAAVLLPSAAWLVRICVTSEPDAARHVVTAAVGAQRAHLAAVLAGAVCATVLGCGGTALVAAVSDPEAGRARGGVAPVPLGTALAAGLCAVLACVLVGVAVGTLCNRPLVRARGWAVAGTLLGTVLALAAGVSPANAAVSALVGASARGGGAVTVPWSPVLVAAVCAAGAAWAACCAAVRRP